MGFGASAQRQAAAASADAKLSREQAVAAKAALQQNEKFMSQVVGMHNRQAERDSQIAEQSAQRDAALAKRQADTDASHAREQQKHMSQMVQLTQQQADREAATAERQQEHQARCHEQMQSMQAKHAQTVMNMMAEQQAQQRERDERFMEFLKANPGKEAELEKANQELQEKLEKAEADWIEDAGDPEKYETKQIEIFQNFCDKVGTLGEPGKTTKPSVAVLGPSGVGKSSLINALVGKAVTPVGITETTMDIIKAFESDTTQFYDVPGQNEERSYANLKHIMAIKTMHFIILAYCDRIDHVVKMERLIKACNVPYVAVRTKCDKDMDEEEAQANGYDSAAQCLQVAHDTESKKIQGNLVYVSAKTGMGLDDLRAVPAKLGIDVILGMGESE